MRKRSLRARENVEPPHHRQPAAAPSFARSNYGSRLTATRLLQQNRRKTSNFDDAAIQSAAGGSTDMLSDQDSRKVHRPDQHRVTRAALEREANPAMGVVNGLTT